MKWNEQEGIKLDKCQLYALAENTRLVMQTTFTNIIIGLRALQIRIRLR